MMDITSKAEISSETAIVPSCAAIAEPTLAELQASKQALMAAKKQNDDLLKMQKDLEKKQLEQST